MNFADPTTYASDIPFSTAKAAHDGTSFNPEERGKQEVEGWCQTMAQHYTNLRKAHAPTPEKVAILDAAWERFRAGYRTRYLQWLRSRAGIVSTMIAGPANFPVRRMEKRNQAAHRRLEDLTTFKERAVRAIVSELHPEWKPIAKSDSDALERLQAELRELERTQEMMKAANAIIRKHHKDRDECVRQLVILGLSEESAREITTPNSWKGIGFPSYRLTNNSANIRRVKGRIAEVEKLHEFQRQVEQREGGGMLKGPLADVELAPGENRIRLHFPAKPDRDTIQELKSNGFRWAPSLGAWSAYFKRSTLAKAKELAGLTQAPEAITHGH